MIGEREAGIALASRYRSILLLEEARILDNVAEVRIIVFLHGRHLYLGLEIGETYGLKTASIVNMEEVVEALYNQPYNGKTYIGDAEKAAIDAYYEKYGAR